MAANMTRAELMEMAEYARVREEFELVAKAGQRACIKSAMLNVDALMAAIDQLAAHQAEGWQPISTAPKDRSYVLAYRAGFADSMAIAWWSSGSQAWERSGSQFAHATHWMSLPPIPSNGGAGEAL